MKSDNDPIDDALRNALQRKFGDFESVPGPAVNEKAAEDIRVFSKRPNPGLMVTAICLVGLGILVWMILPEKEADGPVKSGRAESGLSRKHATGAGRADRAALPKEDDRPVVSANSSGTGERGDAGYERPGTREAGHSSPGVKVSVEKIAGETGNSLNGQSRRKKARIFPAPVEVPVVRTGSRLEEYDRSISLPEIKEVFSSRQPEITAGLKLRSVEGAGFVPGELSDSGSNGEQDDGPFFPGDKSSSELSPVFSVTGINTFYNLIVLPQQSARLQNVELPVSFRNVGFNAEAGLEKSGFQLMVGFSRFSQRISYEVATDEYFVERQEQGLYEAKRRGIPVSEQARFNLLGLSLKKQVYFRSAARRRVFYGQLGVSFNHDLSSSFNSGWVHLGAGKNIKISDRLLLGVGPYAGYSFRRINSTNDAFRFRPLQIGVTAGLKLRRD